MFEPTINHLSKLERTIQELGCDVAFAHDFDADRVTLIGEKGQVYREDVIVALLWKHILERAQQQNKKTIKTVTNCASSLMLDDLAKEYGATIKHTPVGERNLAVAMNNLKEETSKNSAKDDPLIFGGEGSCGGFMYPNFNNTRDGIFAAVLICETLLKTRKTVSELVAEIPTYESTRKNIHLEGKSPKLIIDKLKEDLEQKGTAYDTIDKDVKVFGQNEWTLVHPSNTEPIMRIIAEAKTTKRTEELVKSMHEKLMKL